MPDMQTKEALLQQNRQLQARLEELEETLRAIRSGEVDALVVSTQKGEQVYTLQSADESYRVMIEEMREGAVTTAVDGTILYCNSRFAELLQLPMEQVVSSPLWSFVPVEDRSALETMLEQTRELPLRREFSLQAADGTRRFVLFSTHALKRDTVEAIAAVVTDFTELKAAEQAAKDRAKKLQMFFHLSYLAERNNFSLESLYQDVVNVLPTSWQYPEIACARIVMGGREFRTDNFRVSEWMQTTPVIADGAAIGRIEVGYLERMPEQDEGPFLKEERQLIVAVAERVGHITRRKQTEEKLQQSLDLLQMITETIQDVFWISMPGRKEILYISPAYERIWERSCESLYRNPLSLTDAVHPDDRTTLIRTVDESHTHGKAYDIQYRIVKSSGDVRWMHERGFPILNDDGKLKAMTGVVSDITELKNTQAKLEQSQQHLEELVQERTAALRVSEERYRDEAIELEAANAKLQELDRLKSMFIASMSHELRTPLNSVIGFTGVILQGMTGPISDEQRKQLTIVKESAAHLLQLINDVIDVSKIEAGKVDVVIAEFDLAELAREVAASFVVSVQKKGIELALEVPERLPVTSDQKMIRQIMVNLLGNAVKFTDSGRIALRLSAVAEGVEIAVLDTGIGIRGEDMEKLFSAFSQIMAEGRSKEGSGLGLYLSQKMARLMGGRITVQSEPGKGSTFTLYLPANFRRTDA